MVLYGDSHALMWFQAMNAIAKEAHWRLVIVAHSYCAVDRFLPPEPPTYFNRICGPWQNQALRWIKEVNPDLVIATQEAEIASTGRQYTEKEWQQGLEDGLKPLQGPHTTFIVLGNIPQFAWYPADCLSLHEDAVQQCSESLRNAIPTRSNGAEARAAMALGGRYINVVPWFCSDRCSVVVGRYQPYLDRQHVTEAYSFFLERVLAEQLQLSKL
jgi:SGNH domain (fused to AT3 domains)